MPDITVEFAVYGALVGGNENKAQAADVSSALQNCINSMDDVVTISNKNLGGDPSPKNRKHFGAKITRSEGTYFYACREGETIDFKHGGKPGE